MGAERKAKKQDKVQVHYNSMEPGKLDAEAFTQGNHIYLGPGQEKYLGHELGHVVQQREGRVTANESIDGRGVNTDPALERQADSFQTSMAADAGLQVDTASSAAPADAAAPIQMGGHHHRHRRKHRGPVFKEAEDVYVDELPKSRVKAGPMEEWINPGYQALLEQQEQERLEQEAKGTSAAKPRREEPGPDEWINPKYQAMLEQQRLLEEQKQSPKSGPDHVYGTAELRAWGKYYLREKLNSKKWRWDSLRPMAQKMADEKKRRYDREQERLKRRGGFFSRLFGRR